MSDDLQTRDKQNQEADSSEQYAINIIGNRTLQSADLVLKESKRTVEKALAGKPVPQQFKRGRLWTSPITPRQAPTAEIVPPDRGAHTPTETSIWQEMKDKPISSKPYDQYHGERQGQFFDIADDIPGEPVPIHVEPASLLAEEKSVAEPPYSSHFKKIEAFCIAKSGPLSERCFAPPNGKKSLSVKVKGFPPYAGNGQQFAFKRRILPHYMGEQRHYQQFAKSGCGTPYR